MAIEKTDLQLAIEALIYKKREYDLFWRYYEGPHPIIYSREKLKEIFNEINARFTENWCAVVVDSAIDKIQLDRFVIPGNTSAEETLSDLVALNELKLESDDVHLASLVTGESFVIVWPDDDDIPQAYYNDSRLVHVFYEADNPRKIRYAAKWWVTDDFYTRITLYYPDRLEYYQSRNKMPAGIDGRRKDDESPDATTDKSFLPIEGSPVENPYETVPVFHFRRERRAIRSELANVIEPQDGINKLLADMMVAAEFAAFRQRWIITQGEIDKLKNSPGEVWKLPAGFEGEQQTSAGEFSATDLAGYLQGINNFAIAIGIITRTPKHYFFNQAGDPSGESLIALEAPLNKKSAKYIERFAVTWCHLAQFMLRLANVQVDLADIEAVYKKPETVQPRTQAEIRQMNVAAGIPLTTVLRDEGWSDDDLDQMAQDKRDEQSAQQSQLGAALVGAMRGFDQGGENGNSGAAVANGVNGS